MVVKPDSSVLFRWLVARQTRSASGSFRTWSFHRCLVVRVEQHVRVRVDQAGQQRRSVQVDHAGVRRRLHVASRADGLDFLAANDHDPAFVSLRPTPSKTRVGRSRTGRSSRSRAGGSAVSTTAPAADVDAASAAGFADSAQPAARQWKSISGIRNIVASGSRRGLSEVDMMHPLHLGMKDGSGPPLRSRAYHTKHSFHRGERRDAEKRQKRASEDLLLLSFSLSSLRALRSAAVKFAFSLRAAV